MTTITATTTTADTGLVTATLPARDLRRVLASVLPHACTDRTLLYLCSVLITVADGRLTTAATDRYTLGTDHAATSAATGRLSYLADSHHIPALVKTLRALATPNPHVTLSLHRTDLQDPGDLIVTATGDSMRVGNVGTPDCFPTTHRLFEEFTPARTTAFTTRPETFKNFAASATAYDPHAVLRVTHGTPGTPMHVQIGDTFRGLWMPVKDRP
jgi:hypothetical protein